MTTPHLRESGPGYRTWDMPDGTILEQRVQSHLQFTRLKLDASDATMKHWEQALLDEASSAAVAQTDDPLIRVEFRGWHEEQDHTGWSLVGEAVAYYWPRLPEVAA